MYGMFFLNFGIVLALSIVYAYLVKGRVEKFDYSTGTETSKDHDGENQAMLILSSPRQNPRDVRECLSHFSTFAIYIAHLLIARIIPLLLFASVFYLAYTPNNFPCPWRSEIQKKGTSTFNDTFNSRQNFTIIDCTNPIGQKSKTLVDIVATVDAILVTLAFSELGYIAWLAFNDRDFMTDQEFCTVYLLRKRKRIRKLVNKVRERFNPDNQLLFQLEDDFGGKFISLLSLEDIYVNVVIQEEREHMNAYPETFDRHGIYKSHLETPRAVTKLRSAADIFKPKKDGQDQTYPRTILVIGRPGIGKTMLTKKLLQQWKRKENEFWHEKMVILLQFRTFNNKSVTVREMLGHGEGLSSDNFETVYRFILLNPTKTILIFDGLDELDVCSNLLRTNKETVSNPNEKMPVFSIFKMLVDGRLLSGVTVLITSRPTAERIFGNLNVERTVEILGFFREEIKEYVFKFCQNDNDTAKMIWNQIEESAELLSLCYIPVNSYIVCLTLKESTANDEGRNIPKTITELYKRAVKVLIYRHHPIYKFEPLPPDYLITPFPKELENDLLKLKKVAQNGIFAGKLIFERKTGDEFGDLANCGLFHKLPDKQRNYFCFIHLTLQEFLAASKVVDDMDNVETFLNTHIDDPKMHLVIQFVVGLVGDKIKEAKMSQRILADIQKRYYLFSL